MKLGPVVSALVAVGALCVGGYAFLSSSIPYVSAEEAVARAGQPVHVAGDIVRESVRNNVMQGVLEFQITDYKGEKLQVRYHGPKPSNFDSAPKVSVSGTFEEGVFVADKMLVKCPSKYEAEDPAANPH